MSDTAGLCRRSWYAAVAVLVGAAAWRFIGFDFTNDDLLFLAIGRQIAVFGEWPVRDLFEEGDPLHNIASAVLLTVTGHSLAGEALFDILLLSIAAALVTLVSSRWLRSATAGAFVGALTVLAWPRLYDYPKALIPAAGLWLCAWYQRRPGYALAAAMGVTIGLSFLLRHDFGMYVAAAMAVAIAVTARTQRTALMPALAVCAATAAVLVVPYLAYVQAHTGIASYLRSAQRFTQREVSRSDDRPPAFVIDWDQPLWRRDAPVPVKVRWAASVDVAARADAEQQFSLTGGEVDDGRTWRYLLADSSPANLYALVRDPRVEDTANIDRSIARGDAPAETSRLQRVLESRIAVAPGLLTRANAVAWLYSLFRWLPVAAVGVLALMRWRRVDPGGLAAALPALAFCALSAPLLLRGNLYENSRLADFTTPAAILAASLIAVAWRAPARSGMRLALRASVVLLVAITALAIGSFGQTPRRIATVLSLVDAGLLKEEATRLWRGMTATPPPLDWMPREGGVRGAVEYLRSCTQPSDRILVSGFYPDIVYFSGRGAAADRVVLLRGFGVDPVEERATIAAMRRHPAALAIIETNKGDGSIAGHVIDGLHPLTEQYIATQFVRVGATDFGGSTGTLFDVWIHRARTAQQGGPFSLPCLSGPRG